MEEFYPPRRLCARHTRSHSHATPYNGGTEPHGGYTQATGHVPALSSIRWKAFPSSRACFLTATVWTQDGSFLPLACIILVGSQNINTNTMHTYLQSPLIYIPLRHWLVPTTTGPTSYCMTAPAFAQRQPPTVKTVPNWPKYAPSTVLNLPR